MTGHGAAAPAADGTLAGKQGTGLRLLLYWLLAFVLSSAAVVASMFYLDRPAADYFHAHVHTAVYFWINRALAPIVGFVVLALLFLVVMGCWTAARRAPPPWTKTPLLCSWSLVWALSTTVVLKRAFGLSWPYPNYVQSRIYEFHWLHGGHGYDSFPSGTATIAGSFVAVLWTLFPRLRVLAVLVFLFLISSVVVTNGHWISDVIGGGFLGTVIGWMTVRLRHTRLIS